MEETNMNFAADISAPLACSSPLVTVSIVSHGHGAMVLDLLNDLSSVVDCRINVILTLNIPEAEIFEESPWPFPLTLIRNLRARGFGKNHNTAFSLCTTPYFCVLNPDIRLHQGSLKLLLQDFGDLRVGAVGPLVFSPDLSIDDSARKFPTLTGLAWRFISGVRKADYFVERGPVNVDWLAGMFVLFKRETFVEVGGFDEGYFMYLEDVDICRRLHERNLQVRLNPDFQVIHAAQRASKKSLRHLSWHLRSVARYFLGINFRTSV